MDRQCIAALYNYFNHYSLGEVVFKSTIVNTLVSVCILAIFVFTFAGWIGGQ